MPNKKNLLIMSLGNSLEWFDFGLFIFLAPILGEKFFPTHDIKTATIAAFGVFAAGYICRPLGGILFGYFGDTQGRATTLRFSILTMTITTLIIGFLPTYQSIGLTAAILFTGLRMLQGISIGGEYSGAIIYLAESTPLERRGFITSFAGAGANFGFLLATLLVLFLKILLPAADLDAWGWRIPFLIMGAIGFVIFYFRFNLIETKVFQFIKQQNYIERKPLWDAFRFAPKKVLQVLGLTCMSSSFYMIFFGYVPNYLVEHAKIPANYALILQSIALFLMFFLIPLSGKLGDRLGRKKMLFYTAISILIFLFPGFYLLQQPSLFLIALALLIATLLSSLDQGNNLATFVENCPANIRYSAIAFSYNLGNALFGAPAPLLATLLVNKYTAFAPAYLLILTAIVSLLTILTLFNKDEVLSGEHYFAKDVSLENIT